MSPPLSSEKTGRCSLPYSELRVPAGESLRLSCPIGAVLVNQPESLRFRVKRAGLCGPDYRAYETGYCHEMLEPQRRMQ